MQKKMLLSLFLLITMSYFSINLGIYSDGIFLETPLNNITLKAGYPTFGLSYNKNETYINYNLTTDFNLNNPQLNNYISASIGINLNKIEIYSGLWNSFNELNASSDSTTSNIGNNGFFTGISSNINNLRFYFSLYLKVGNWVKSSDIITKLPSFMANFDDSPMITLGLNYEFPINNNNKINIFFNFGTNYISFPNGLTLYQFKNNYNFGVLLTLNDLIKQEE
ncbi:hypothetical protein JCM30566_01690 [Marinitoga arctica]